MKETLTTAKHKEFLEYLIAGDRPACSRYAHEYVAQNHSIQELYEEILRASLYDVGKLWEYNQISVATEHLAAAIVEAILSEFYKDIISREKSDKRVILCCVEKEVHQIGIKMISDLFEMNGWYSYFLGANTPTTDLMDYIRVIDPHLLGISTSIYFHLPTLDDMLQRIRQKFPDLPVLVGGQAFACEGEALLEQHPHVYYEPDLKSTEVFIDEFMQNR
jgi:methanogenic corrinoid protein MtbC1